MFMGINEYRALLVRRFMKIAKPVSMENAIFTERLQEVGLMEVIDM